MVHDCICTVHTDAVNVRKCLNTKLTCFSFMGFIVDSKFVGTPIKTLKY